MQPASLEPSVASLALTCLLVRSRFCVRTQLLTRI
jgi:hypothetical protein